MYDIRPLPKQIASSTLAKLSMVETATVGHFQMHNFMDARIRPIQTGVRVCGTAVTVQTVGIDSTTILIAIDALRPGDLLVIDRSGEDRHASFGAVMAAAAVAAGVVAVIIDGKACDFPDIRKQGLPVWCTGASPILCKRLNLGRSVNAPISCGGVAVNPGDAVLADDSGILIIPYEHIEKVISEALMFQDREVTVLDRISKGEKLSDIANLPKFTDYFIN